ncbi:hypothetical protein ScPMuIL_006190 [Solemya velum]
MTEERLLVVARPTQSQKIETKKKPKKILDEDTYAENIVKIIQRDFYPDVPKLEAQSEYFEALEKNDLVKLREIQIRYSRGRPSTTASSIYNTPETFETPEPRSRQGKEHNEDNEDNAECTQEPAQMETETTLLGDEKEKKDKQVGLDHYMMHYTSEDNASFTDILEKSEKKHREKHAWLYEHEEKSQQEKRLQIALPTIEEQASIKNGQPEEWEYKIKNHLMYVPDGADLSAKEIVELQKAKQREIIHENTRFHSNPWNTNKNKETIKEAATMKALTNMGKIGHDGKEVVLVPSPQVNGYGFVATPSPAPGVEESPLMTWGELEGTPFRLDGSDTPVNSRTPGPNFKIPEVPKRDRIAMDLAQKAIKNHRDKKEKAMKSVTARFSTPSPKFGKSTTERLNSMSPAAQRLVTSRLGIRKNTDKALRASYSPSPVHKLPGDKTPICLTPKSSRSDTPSSFTGTPTRTPENKHVSLTDNLLNLPKRQRAAASDFFS